MAKQPTKEQIALALKEGYCKMQAGGFQAELEQAECCADSEADMWPATEMPGFVMEGDKPNEFYVGRFRVTVSIPRS